MWLGKHIIMTSLSFAKSIRSIELKREVWPSKIKIVFSVFGFPGKKCSLNYRWNSLNKGSAQVKDVISPQNVGEMPHSSNY